MLATVGTIIAVLATVIGLIVQILTAGIYIGKLEGFKELINHCYIWK